MTTSGSRMEASDDNQTYRDQSDNEKTQRTSGETSPVESNQSQGRPCPYYLRSRIQEKTESMRTSATSKSTAYLAAHSAEEASVWKR
ncbi:hypothetical protein TNCV_1754551 [Trichonephila clavipes]|nr:hypothetical protein TNCV_1754551 [Trichonephila clavipes]